MALVGPEPSRRENVVRLARGTVPALIIGVLSALVLIGVDLTAEALSHVLWVVVPDALGVPADGPLWIFGVLTTIGFCVGLVLQFAPGRGGPDSATHGLAAPPPPLRSVPGIAVIAVLVLAGGVSLGPEAPVIGIASALVVALTARLGGVVPRQAALLMAIAGTVGAMFGTPVAAALLLTAVVAGATAVEGELWDKLFLPLAAAAAGAATMWALGAPSVAQGLPAYEKPELIHLLLAPAIAVVTAAVGVAGAVLLPRVHRLMHSIPSPLLMATIGGVVLGLLGILGGPLSLFRGLDEIVELLREPGALSPVELLSLAAIKLLAVIVATSTGFRGGRIFPGMFIGVAVGLAVVAVVPNAPLGLCIGSAVVGIVLAMSRDGWLALLLAVVVVGDVSVLPLLCLAVLPAWLLVTASPPFIVSARPNADSDAAPGT